MTRASRLVTHIAVFATLLGGHNHSPARSQEREQPKPLVRFPYPRDEGSLTPYTFDSAYSLVTLVYDTLLWRDPDGVPQAWLARSVETSQDGLRVTVLLSEGARWHDAKPVTASDVAFSYLLYSRRPHPRFSPQLRAVRSVETPAPNTIVFNLRWPSPGFSDQPLSDVPIVPRRLWENLPEGKPAPDGLPVGSGPYRLVEHRAAEIYRFEAVSDYFRGQPSVLVIEVPIIPTTEARVQAFEKRELDLIQVSFPKRAVDRVRRAGVRLVDRPSFAGTVLVLNTRRPPFDRIEARQAVAKAIDLSRIRRVIGRAVGAQRGFLHPDSPWASETTLHIVDERGARAAIAELKLPALQILAPSNDLSNLEAGQQVALALQRVGAAAEMKRTPEHELSKALGEDGSDPNFEIAIWNSPTLASYDPLWLSTLFLSDPRVGTLNFSGYSSNEFDRAAATITSTLDVGQRKTAVGEALRLLSADRPVVPLFFMNGVFAYRPQTHDGWVFGQGSGAFDKRSFTDPRAPMPPLGNGSPVEAEEGKRLSILGIMGAVALGLALVLALVDFRRQRKSAT